MATLDRVFSLRSGFLNFGPKKCLSFLSIFLVQSLKIRILKRRHDPKSPFGSPVESISTIEQPSSGFRPQKLKVGGIKTPQFLRVFLSVPKRQKMLRNFLDLKEFLRCDLRVLSLCCKCKYQFFCCIQLFLDPRTLFKKLEK